MRAAWAVRTRARGDALLCPVPKVFESPRVVAPTDIDVLGHVSNQIYIAWLLEAAEAHSAAVGLDWDRYRELGGVFVVRRHEFDYLAPAHEGDRVRVRTWIAESQRVTSVRAYEVLRGETPLVRARTVWAFIELESGRPRRIPASVREAFGIVSP